ncbi:MAG: B12-binding domain-containing radical SAM protein [Deltaproteobacteria bacterium RIFOXYD12_FULL_57_12]|nr:MAG: B12-binding domain-containing radical SAM protein [Deltaproteobacteria bacterium RIFOXYD12_FULL_57_12]
MKCALIIPAWVPDEIFSSKTAGSQINYWQPLGTLYVASSLIQAGHEVRFFNGAFMSQAAILLAVEEFRPEFVGLYSTTFGWPKAKQTARDLKTRHGHLFIAVGGPYPIAMQEKCLEDCEAIDATVTGEGELTVPEMVARLASCQSLAGVAGVVYRDQDAIRKNPTRPLITDLDALPPPARELLGDADHYIPPPATYKRRPVAVLITSRGCNRRCLYCFQIDKSRKSGIRYRSVANVMAEIELILSQGYKEIKFIDDTLAADYDRAMEIARQIKARGLDFSWFASACVNQVDKPLLQAFKDAGCWAVLFGAESGVQKDLNTIRKGITLAQIRLAVKAAKEVGLTVYTPFLFGIPGQTFADGLQSIEFACELDPDIANFHAITPFPGTELYDNIEKYGTMSTNLQDFSYQGAAFVPYSMTREQIAELRQIAFRRFYSRPRFLARRLLKIRTGNDLRAALYGLRSMFWLWAKSGVFRRS